ncbi:MAG: PaaI family thioesterase [Anaerolineales bacterium]
MRYRVTSKQENSNMCFVCGLKNPFGLQASFYELENRELLGIFRPSKEHQGYPGRLHGGIASTILDETIGRAIMIEHDQIWGVTLEINLRYRKPVPIGKEIHVLGRIEKDTHRGFQGSGEILLENGKTAVEARGKYLKMPFDQITEAEAKDLAWKVTPSNHDPEVIEFE